MTKKFTNKNKSGGPFKRKEEGQRKPFLKNRNESGKSFKKEASGEQRKDENLVYGFHAVREILLNPQRRIDVLYLNNPDQFKDDFAVQKRLSDIKVQILSKAELDSKLPYAKVSHEVVHQGVAIKASPLPERGLDELLQVLKDKEKSCIVMLDQVTDPHNIGAILRSACVFGADAVIVQDKNAPDINPTMTKIACGAVEHIAYIKEVNLSRALETLQKKEYWCIALDERGEQTVQQAVQNLNKVVLVMGAEGPGLRPLVAKTCDQLARLPVFGAIPSLNVSNAAAVALYEVVRDSK